jgi:hypothetical protein
MPYCVNCARYVRDAGGSCPICGAPLSGGGGAIGEHETGSLTGLWFTLGSLLIVSFFVPWGKGLGDKLIMSWDVIDKADKANLTLLLVFPPIAGLAMLILNKVVPRIARGATFLILGVVGMSIYLSLLKELPLEQAMTAGRRGLDLESFLVLSLVGTCFLSLSVGGARLRLVHPQSLTARLFGGITAAISAVLLLICVINFFNALSDSAPSSSRMSSKDGEGIVTVSIIMMLVIAACYVTSLVLSLVNLGPHPPERARALASGSIWTGIGVAIGWVVWLLLIVVIATSDKKTKGDEVLFVLMLLMNLMGMQIAYYFLLGGGASELTQGIVESLGGPAAAAAVAAPRAAPATPQSDDVSQRLQKLQEMYQQGLITQKDFEAQKQRILGEL